MLLLATVDESEDDAAGGNGRVISKRILIHFHHNHWR
jgi:hypothetical protein